MHGRNFLDWVFLNDGDLCHIFCQDDLMILNMILALFLAKAPHCISITSLCILFLTMHVVLITSDTCPSLIHATWMHKISGYQQ